MQKLLEKLPAITALIAATSLTASIAHEWVFFAVYDLPWIGILSIQDYVRLSIEWLPLIILGTIWTFAYWWSALCTDSITSVVNKTASSETSSAIPWVIYAVTAAIPLFLSLFSLARNETGFMAALKSDFERIGESFWSSFIYVGICLANVFFVKFSKVIRSRITNRFQETIIYTWPIFALGIPLHAYSSAQRIENKNRFPVHIEYADRKSSEALGIIKIVDRGILLRNFDEGSTIFVPWNEIKSITGVAP